MDFPNFLSFLDEDLLSESIKQVILSLKAREKLENTSANEIARIVLQLYKVNNDPIAILESHSADHLR